MSFLSLEIKQTKKIAARISPHHSLSGTIGEAVNRSGAFLTNQIIGNVAIDAGRLRQSIVGFPSFKGTIIGGGHHKKESIESFTYLITIDTTTVGAKENYAWFVEGKAPSSMGPKGAKSGGPRSIKPEDLTPKQLQYASQYLSYKQGDKFVYFFKTGAKAYKVQPFIQPAIDNFKSIVGDTIMLGARRFMGI